MATLKAGTNVAHASEFLQSLPQDLPAVIVLTGEERALKLAAIDAIRSVVLPDADDAPTRFAGRDAKLCDVRDELKTLSMWGDRRLVIVDEASDFVSDNRAALEKYADAPAKKAVLLLDVKTLAKNTRLFGIVSSKGLVIECTELKGVALQRWIQETARRKHNKSIDRNAAELLVELAGTSLGLLDQELSKLAAYSADENTIDSVAVRKLVGGWRAETTWAMTDATRDGRLNDALAALDSLLVSGEAPLKIHGGIGYVFRKMAVATELARQGTALPVAIREAGCFPAEAGPVQSYLRRIGRPRAERILHWILETDLSLKGGSRTSDRSQLELLLIRLSGAEG